MKSGPKMAQSKFTAIPMAPTQVPCTASRLLKRLGGKVVKWLKQETCSLWVLGLNPRNGAGIVYYAKRVILFERISLAEG